MTKHNDFGMFDCVHPNYYPMGYGLTPVEEIRHDNIIVYKYTHTDGDGQEKFYFTVGLGRKFDDSFKSACDFVRTSDLTDTIVMFWGEESAICFQRSATDPERVEFSTLHASESAKEGVQDLLSSYVLVSGWWERLSYLETSVEPESFEVVRNSNHLYTWKYPQTPVKIS